MWPRRGVALVKMTEKEFAPIQILMSVAGAALMASASLLGCAWELTKQAGTMIVAGALLIAVPQIVIHTRRLRRGGIRQRDEALATLTDLCLRLLELPEDVDPRVTILLVNQDYRRPTLQAVARSCAKERSVPKSTMEVTQGVAGLCYRRQSIVVQEDVPDFMATMKDLGFEEQDAKQFKMDRKNYACIPVMDSTNNVLAVLSLDAREPNVYDAARVELAEKFTPFFARLLTSSDHTGE
ncbi:MAG: hypothetical protein JWN02_539 [Acidobacteria bacterium]|nr:hypothetical protein [Acidobacteriota bacterium]